MLIPNPAAPSHDSPPQAPLRDGGCVQLVQRHRELRPELHLLHLDLLPAGRRREGRRLPGEPVMTLDLILQFLMYIICLYVIFKYVAIIRH